MVKDNKQIKMGVLIKGHLSMIKRVAMVFIFGLLEIITEGIFLMTKDKVMVKCIGSMELFIKVFGMKGNRMVKESYPYRIKY
jgi:hypothetical protein